jgi:hypothetical protein
MLVEMACGDIDCSGEEGQYITTRTRQTCLMIRCHRLTVQLPPAHTDHRINS